MTGAGAMLVTAAAPRAPQTATDADVVVVGAGLAGLHAAQLLENAGAKVLVVEAERRVGGRLHTLDDLPGRPEAGAIQIGQGYRRLEAEAARCGIALVPGGAESRGVLYRIRGTTVTGADWATSAANSLSAAEHAILPAALAPHYWSKLATFARLESWLEDDLRLLDISYATALERAGASAEAMRLIAANLNGNSLATLSQVHVMRSLAIARAGAGAIRLIEGGSQRLPEAMAARLKTLVRLRTRVTAIGVANTGVEISVAQGRPLRARHVLVTIPFAAMRNLPIDAPLDPAITALRRALPYTHASFAYLSARTPFWRNDGLPETLWTDEAVLGRVFVLGNDPPMLKVWVTGTNADRLDAMPDSAAGQAIVTAIEAARPSAQGQLALVKRFSWMREPSARGMYHHIGVGQAEQLARAVQANGGRVHFAGEHLAKGASGIEGALESGARAAEVIIAKL